MAGYLDFLGRAEVAEDFDPPAGRQSFQLVQLLTGDQEFDSPKTLAAFGLGLTLFLVTLTLNVIALQVVQKYRQAYD